MIVSSPIPLMWWYLLRAFFYGCAERKHLMIVSSPIPLGGWYLLRAIFYGCAERKHPMIVSSPIPLGGGSFCEHFFMAVPRGISATGGRCWIFDVPSALGGDVGLSSSASAGIRQRSIRARYHEGKYFIGLQDQPADREGNYILTHRRRMMEETFEIQSGLYPGYGTHFIYVYVGTPPQRVSVIVDTGSHFTAFPCKGCKDCGKHINPYYDLSKSSTSHQLNCSECVSARCSNQKQCTFAQSYSEGSSWQAFQVRDQVYPGMETVVKTAAENVQRSINFIFGCQSTVLGLFKKQKADGIMGLSRSPNSLVKAMYRAGAIHNKSFAMCFKPGGGVLSIGGMDTRLHQQTMQFVPLIRKRTNFFTVRLKEIRVGSERLDVEELQLNSGKGVIVDSGMTDTSLNQQVALEFKAKWQSLTGRKYSNKAMRITAVQVSKLPSITFVFANGVEVVTKPEAYMEKKKNALFTPRIYLDTRQGCVLGANFMNHHDVLFDEENKRLGFAASDCSMEF